MTANNHLFSEFGESFQNKVFQALLFDKKFAEQLIEVFNPQYFEFKHLQFLADRFFTYSKKYKDFPSLHLLITIIKDDLKRDNDAKLKQDILVYLQKIKSNPDSGDLQYIKDKSLEFCRKQCLKLALESAVEQMQAEKYEAIVDTIKKAVMVGTTPDLGHDFFLDYEARFVASKRNCIPTGLDQLDAILNGGMGAGELICMIAASGGGKCTKSNTKIKIRYTGICINGKNYKPWEKIKTKRGNIFAKNVVENDEIID